MYVNSLLTTNLWNSINQRQTEKIVDTVATNKKINLSQEQLETFKDVLSAELKTMHSTQQLLSSYLNTAGNASSFSNPYLSGLGLLGGSTTSLQQSGGLMGSLGLYSTTSLSNLIPAYLSAQGTFNSIIPRNMAANAYHKIIDML